MFIITYLMCLFLSPHIFMYYIFLYCIYRYINFIHIYSCNCHIHKFCFFKDSSSALQIESSVHRQNVRISDKVTDSYFCIL